MIEMLNLIVGKCADTIMAVLTLFTNFIVKRCASPLVKLTMKIKTLFVIMKINIFAGEHLKQA